MGDRGFEPLTSSVSRKRSPPELIARGRQNPSRRGPESNRCARLCRPLPNHSATPPKSRLTVPVDTRMAALRKPSGWTGRPLDPRVDAASVDRKRCIAPTLRGMSLICCGHALSGLRPSAPRRRPVLPELRRRRRHAAGHRGAQDRHGALRRPRGLHRPRATPRRRASERDPRAFFATATEELQNLRGRPEKFIGDAVMAVFGLPHVHEDDAVRAVRAGLAIRARVRRLGRSRGLAEPLDVRVGIESGEAATGEGPRRTTARDRLRS